MKVGIKIVPADRAYKDHQKIPKNHTLKMYRWQVTGVSISHNPGGKILNAENRDYFQFH